MAALPSPHTSQWPSPPPPLSQVWALAHLALAGCKEGVAPHHRANPVAASPRPQACVQPGNPTRRRERGAGRGRRWCGRAAARRRRRASPGQERLHVAPATARLWCDHGLVGAPRRTGDIRVCRVAAARSARRARRIHLPPFGGRVGAAEPGLAPRCKHKVSPDFVAEV